MNKKYNKQVAEIETLCKSLIKKANSFNDNVSNPYYQDLDYLKNQLKELDKHFKG